MYTEEQYWSVLEAITNVQNGIRCETEDEAIMLGKILAKAGIYWPNSETSLAEKSLWGYYKSETTYSIDPSNGCLEYCYREYYLNEGFNVIDFSSIISPVSLLDILSA